VVIRGGGKVHTLMRNKCARERDGGAGHFSLLFFCYTIILCTYIGRAAARLARGAERLGEAPGRPGGCSPSS